MASWKLKYSFVINFGVNVDNLVKFVTFIFLLALGYLNRNLGLVV